MVRVAPINLTFNPKTLWFDPGDLEIQKDDPVVVRTAAPSSALPPAR